MYVSQYRQQEPPEHKGDGLQGQLRDYLSVNGHSISGSAQEFGEVADWRGLEHSALPWISAQARSAAVDGFGRHGSSALHL
jgi:hypothetical protein